MQQTTALVVNGLISSTTGSASNLLINGGASGVGSVKLANTGNSFTNGITVTQGTLLVGGNAPAGGVSVLGNNAGAINLADGGTPAANWTISGGNLASGDSGNPAILTDGAFTVARSINLSNAATFSGGPSPAVTGNGSPNSYIIGGNSANASTFSGAVTVTTNAAADKLLRLSQVTGGTVTLSGVINPNADATRVLNVEKVGAGTVILTNANIYDGTTTVSAGTLRANNATGSATGTGAVAVNSGGTLGGSGIITGAVNINSGGFIAPGNSPGTLNTGATTYNSGGTYQWEVNNATGTKGGDPGYDFNNVTGVLNIASTSSSTFGIDVRALNTSNLAGVVSNWNANAFNKFTLATASGGITNYASDKFAITTSNFTNTNSLRQGGFSVQKSGNDLILAFNPAGGGSGANGLVQGLGIFASDNASQSAYTGGNLNGQNGGFGYGAWATNDLTTFRGTFVGDAKNNSGGANAATPSGNFINTVGAKSFGLFANTSNTSDDTRTITGGLATGRTLSLDFDSGFANGSSSQGFSFRNSSGNNVFEFFYDAAAGKYRINDSAGVTSTTQGFTGDGLHTEFTQTSATGYIFTISGPGITTQSFTGSVVNATGGTSIDRFRTFDFNSPSSDTSSDFNAFFNSPTVTLPTFNGQAGATGNFSTATNWAAHSPVNGGSIAFDGGAGAISANNDNLTSVYNIAFNAAGTPNTGNTTTNATTYTMSGNALTINGGINNNSTSLQTINNNLTVGANQSFNATSGALTIGGTVALNGKYLTVNAANAVALSNNITGNGDILKTGSGTLTLSGANSFTGTGVSGQTYGQVFITDGTVRVASNSALGTQAGGVSVDLGDSNLGQTGVINYQNNVSLLANSNLTIGNQLFIANNTVGGGNATRTVGSDGTTGPVIFSGNMLLNGNAVLTAAIGGNVTFSGQVGPTGFTSGGITKSGAGTVILTGNNGYTGGTTVGAGTLLVNNTTGSGTGANTVSVSSGTTLGGNGTISGATTLTTATLAAGGAAATAGTLTFGAGLALNAGSIFDWDMQQVATTDPGVPGAGGTNAGAYDKIVLSGPANSLTGSANNVFKIVLGSGKTFGDAFWDTNKTWTDVFTGSGATTSLASIFSTFNANGSNLIDGFVAGEGTFTLNGSSTLNWTAVPEPSTALAGLLLGAGLIRRRRA